MIFFNVVVPRNVLAPLALGLLAIGAFNYVTASWQAQATNRRSKAIARAGEARVVRMYRHLGIIFMAGGAVAILRIFLRI